MTRTTQALFKKALKLPLESRADLAELLHHGVALFDELGDQRLARLVLLAVVIGEVGERADAVMPGSELEQLLSCLSLWRNGAVPGTGATCQLSGGREP